MFQNLTTQLYLDSQSTIMNDLKDTFSCKASRDSTNILKINTSTYSVSRTANHISQRLEEACRRIQNLQTSANKSKNKKNTSFTNKADSIATKKNSIKQQILQTNNTKQIQLLNNFKSQQQLMVMVIKLKQQSQQKNNKIQKLEQQLLKNQKKSLQLQQKYLKKQKSLILQINKLKQQLQKINNKQNQYYNQKIELQRIIDQHKIKIWELQNKNKELQQNYQKCKNKQHITFDVVNKFCRKLEKDDKYTKGQNKRSRKQKELGEILKKVMGIQDNNEDYDKQNQPQLSNRANPHSSQNKNKYKDKDKQLDEYIEGLTYRSQTIQKRNTSYNYNLQLQPQQPFQQSIHQNNNLYRMLFLQAGTIQKLII